MKMQKKGNESNQGDPETNNEQEDPDQVLIKLQSKYTDHQSVEEKQSNCDYQKNMITRKP